MATDTSQSALLPPDAPQAAKRVSLESFIASWYESPDLEALRITLGAAAAHAMTEADPAWLMIVGPPSCGKSSVYINACCSLAGAHVVGDIGADSFLSCYGKEHKHGLLSRYRYPLLLFKDFTTLMSDREETRHKVMGQLRELYDGSFSKERGVGGVRWEGKCTIIAAATGAIDRDWKVQRDMGERFLTVRLASPNGVNAALVGDKQRGHEKSIAQGIKERALAYVTRLGSPKVNALTGEQSRSIAHLAEFIAQMRRQVTRTDYYPRSICDVSPAELAPRSAKALGLLARMESWLEGTSETSISWARRIAVNSCPFRRIKIIAALPVTGSMDADQIAFLCHQPPEAIKDHLHDLEALGFAERNGSATSFMMTDALRDLGRQAGLKKFL